MRMKMCFKITMKIINTKIMTLMKEFELLKAITLKTAEKKATIAKIGDNCYYKLKIIMEKEKISIQMFIH